MASDRGVAPATGKGKWVESSIPKREWSSQEQDHTPATPGKTGQPRLGADPRAASGVLATDAPDFRPAQGQRAPKAKGEAKARMAARREELMAARPGSTKGAVLVSSETFTREDLEQRRKGTMVLAKPATAFKALPIVVEKSQPAAPAPPPKWSSMRKGGQTVKQAAASAKAYGKDLQGEWSRGKELLTLVWKTPEKVAGLPMLGRIIIATPAALPMVVLSIMLLSVGSLTAQVLLHANAYGISYYSTTAIVAFFCALFNIFLLIANAFLWGFSTLIGLMVVTVFSILLHILSALLGSLFDAVNWLLDHAPGFAGHVVLPTIGLDGYKDGPAFQLNYVWPTAITSCPSPDVFSTRDCGPFLTNRHGLVWNMGVGLNFEGAQPFSVDIAKAFRAPIDGIVGTVQSGWDKLVNIGGGHA